MLSVMDGDARLGTYFFTWNKLVRCDYILTWLFKNRLTGKTLYEWLNQNFGMKALEPAKFILKKIDNTNDLKPIIIGKDYRGNL